MSDSADILIIGGGVIGLTTAWFLAREGERVTLVDPREPGRQASWAGAGILPAASPAIAHPGDELRMRSFGLFAAVSEQLREATGLDNGYRPCGGVEVPADDAREPLEEWGGPAVARALDRAGIDRLAPGLAPHVEKAYHLPGVAQVRNPWHTRALVAACQLAGVDLRPGVTPRGFRCEGERVLGVETDGGPLLAEGTLVAAGAWSGEILREVGFELPVRPVRGQIALLDEGRPNPGPVILNGNRYLVPRGDGLVVVGSTEEEAGFDARPTDEGVAGLLAFARGLVPGLENAFVEKTWAGLRPGSPDGLPFLGRVPGVRGLYVAAGHFRAGICLSPGTALVMAEILTGRPPSVPLDAFRPDRAFR